MRASRNAVCRWFLLVVLVACGPGLLNAKSTPQTDDDDDEPLPALNVNVGVTEDGISHVSGTDFENLHSASTIQAVLQEALGCTLHNAARRLLPNLYYGTCSQGAVGTFVHQIRIATQPLMAYARENRLDVVRVSVNLPNIDVADTDPPVARHAVYPSRISNNLKRMMDLNRFYTLRVDDAAVPEFIFIRVGYRQDGIAGIAGILLAVLFVPALLVIWLGRRALNSDAPDKAPLWFSYMRSLSFLVNASLMGWWIAAESFHLSSLVKFFSVGAPFVSLWASPIATIFVNWCPPLISWVLCFALSAPVQQRLRGLSWTRRELATQALYSFSASMLPLVLFLTGLRLIGTGAFRSGLLWFVAAFVVRVFASQALVKLLAMQPQALTTGDLRERAFAMAQKMGVKLQQLYVIPSGKGQMANAFAHSSNSVSFTDFLLQRMSRREVNYVLAHEMTHLKLGHPGKIAALRGATIGVLVVALPYLRPFLHGSVLIRYVLVFAVATIVPYFWSRRYEYAADTGAVAETRDPQAAISALFKLAQLNLHPIHWSRWTEKWLSHPSTLRRAQAIARNAKISTDLIPEIARRFSGADGHYPLPVTVAAGAKVHSTHSKQSGVRRNSFLLLGAIILTPCAFALVASHIPFGELTSVILYLLGFVATVGVYLLVANYGSVMGHRRLVRDLKGRLAQQQISADAWDGVFVGFSPSNVPKIYELNTNWDVGCFFIRSDRLCYIGEETRFSLRREHITAMSLGAGFPGLLPPKRIYFAWKDDEACRSGVFNIGCLEGSSALKLRRDVAALGTRLDLWRKSAPSTRALPPQLSDLATPNIGKVTAASAHKMWKPSRLLKELYWTALFAWVGAALFGLPFHLMLFLMPIRSSSFVAPMGPGAGWYVIAVALTVRMIALVPALFYKEKPVVIVPSLNPGLTSPKVAATPDTSNALVETEPVSPR